MWVILIVGRAFPDCYASITRRVSEKGALLRRVEFSIQDCTRRSSAPFSIFLIFRNLKFFETLSVA